MDLFSTFYSNLALGMGEAVTLSNLWYCLIGVTLGCLVGVLPGLGSIITISLLLPITYHLPTSGALIMLCGVYFGADYGGGTTSILLGIPGHPAAAVDVLDGYPMTKQGRGGVALFMKTVASAWGSMVGIVLLMLFAPILSNFALQFGPAEYCALMLLGLVAASTVGQGSPVKGVAMMVVGLILGTVGTDINTGELRFNFGLMELSDGVGLIPIAMGIFALAEVIKSVSNPSDTSMQTKFRLRDQLPTREDWRRSFGPMLRGSGLGAFFGTLPGTSGGMATFLAYSVEKRISKHPEEFGKGAIEGIAAPEACNNAGVGTAFIPTLTLGIPGDAIMALILAALVIQGIQPGPQVMTSHPELFWGLIVSFWIGNIFLVILNIPLIGIWVRLLQIPYNLLFPAIILFTCIGVYSTNRNVFDLYALFVFGLMGCGMLLLRLEAVPLLLGFVLGPAFEEYLRRALLLSRGDYGVFIEQPISLAALSVAALVLASSVWSFLRRRRKLAIATLNEGSQ
ncbi:MAG: tripartite tricarboxylate transporter permease [Rhodobacteraceae bacterium]|nr:tripartite tricarboxylate transporter permease [Paracoccaceae bacterium]